MAPGLVAVGAPTLRAIRATTPTPPAPRLAIAHPSRTTVMAGEPVFSWGLIEIADGVYDFGWLDRIMALLHAHGVGVNLATPTAAPPIWLLQAHPEVAPVTQAGVIGRRAVGRSRVRGAQDRGASSEFRPYSPGHGRPSCLTPRWSALKPAGQTHIPGDGGGVPGGQR